MSGGTGRQGLVAVVAAMALALALWPPAGLTPPQAQSMAIALVTISLWGTALVPGYLASLILFAYALILQLAPPPVVFSGFASAATWLVIAGAVIGSAIAVSGLGARLAAVLGPLLGGSYPRLIGGLMLAAMALGFVMPSSIGRSVVLVPVGMAVADRCGFGPGSNGRIGVAVILAIACNMPSFAILPANIPNVILSGAAETILGVRFGYAEYLLLHYPVLGIVKSALAVALVLRLFPARIGAPLPGTAAAEERSGSPAMRLRVSMILLGTLVLWITDSWHGINAAWIAIGTSVLLLMPGIGVVTPPLFKSSVDFGIVLFVAGALAVGALVNGTGLGPLIGQGIERLLPLAPGRDFVNFVSLVAMTIGTGLFTTMPGAPAVLTPIAPHLADLTGLPLTSVLMTQVVGFSTVVLPYQVAPLVVAMQLAGERLSHLARVVLILAAITFAVLVPLDFLWWRLLGWV